MEVTDILKDFRASKRALNKLHEELAADFEFALGKQWDDDDKETLRKAGVKALTINKIKPLIKLISGIERQSRSDYVAFPEGAEDSLIAEITSKLLKNIMKQARGERKLSDQFKEGVIGGLCFLEPYIDYSHDLLNGEMKLKKISGNRIFFDPSSEEYDFSDGRYLIKFTQNLSKEDLYQLFPEDKKKIDNVKERKINLELSSVDGQTLQSGGYEAHFKETGDEDNEETGYDLTEYYYKKMVDRYYIVDPVNGVLEESEDKEAAERIIEQNQTAKLITKQTPEIRIKRLVGNDEIDDDVAWFYPRWKSWHFIPFIAERLTVDVDDDELKIQGIARSLKDLQVEYNKRRTQELRHVNSTVNSGFWVAKGSLDKKNLEALRKYGSSAGFVGEYDPGKSGGRAPERILPQPLPQAHALLAAENAQDLKEASGVNPDLLANSDSDQSGKAILLKQRQGLVMLQEALDNYSDTKKILGRFLLTQLGEVYTVETAIKVCGERFIDKNFKEPQLDGQGKPVTDQKGNLVMQVNPTRVAYIFNQILNDTKLGKYDVSIGEGPYNETIKLANYSMLMDMAQQGIPIPPDVLIEESLIPQDKKEKIIQAIEAERAARAQAAQAQGMKE